MKTMEDIVRWEQDMFAEHGWYIHYVVDEATPCGLNAHTHGLPERWRHPDLQVVVPVGRKNVHAIFDALIDRIKELGYGTLETDELIGGIISGYDVLLADATESGRHVLRVILPDRDGNIAPGSMTGTMARQWDDATILPKGPEDRPD